MEELEASKSKLENELWAEYHQEQYDIKIESI